jgi:hypothetical protein
MVDYGSQRDTFEGDGVYGAELPDAAHNSEVLFRISATSEAGRAEYPVPIDPGVPAPHETWGYYVNDNQVESALPVYHVLLPGVDPTDPIAINRSLNCTVLTPASFAFRGELYPLVGLRFRGNTMCIVDKRNLKIHFRREHLFRGLAKINLQSMWTDKALVREHLAWDFVRETGRGLPYRRYLNSSL